MLLINSGSTFIKDRQLRAFMFFYVELAPYFISVTLADSKFKEPFIKNIDYLHILSAILRLRRSGIGIQYFLLLNKSEDNKLHINKIIDRDSIVDGHILFVFLSFL